MAMVLGFGALAVLVVLLLVFVASRVRTVPVSKALIISGSRPNGETKVVRQGGRTFVIPVLQSVEEISLSQKTIPLSVTGNDKNMVEVTVNAIVIIKVGSDEASIRAASERFLGHKDTEQVVAKNAQDILTGALRSIISRMPVADLIGAREELQQQVLEVVKSELGSMGLETESLQINEISDENGYIENLGVPEIERVKKEARISRARNEQAANDAEVDARQRIAEKNRDLAIKQAQLDAETAKAEEVSRAARPITEAEKQREIAETKTAATQAEAILREKQLDIEVRKPADAALYERQKSAEAGKIEGILQAEASARQLELSSRAQARATEVKAQADANARKFASEAAAYSVKVNGESEAEATLAKGNAEAETIRRRGLAEAEAMDKKAEAFAAYNDAAVIQLIVDRIPEIAAALAEPIASVGELQIISTDGANALPKMVAENFSQLDQVLERTVGTSLSDLVARRAAKGGATER